MKMNPFVFIIIFPSVFFACKDKPFKPNYEFAGGYVIGKEKCNTDTTKDYWLIDLSIFPLQNTYGDTLVFNGVTYNHLVKTLELSPQFKLIGARVGADFHFSSFKVQTLNCNISNPITFLLKEVQIIAQGEMR
jgi:hypothetical protein